jgi:hypothetical protein
MKFMGECIMSWSRASVRLSAFFNLKSTERTTMKFGTDVVPTATAPNRTLQHHKIGRNKTADEEICEVGLTAGALWWPK